jgi:metallo-beta-lactamase family protein
MPLKVKMVGAVGAVTGSCHLLKYERSNGYYMVDCGLYQNVRGYRDMNYSRGNADLGGVSPAKIKAIFLTHAHMDHCGLIPRMYRLGFKGQVICTRITANFVREALNDTVTNVDSFDHGLYDLEDVQAIQFYCPDDKEEFQLGYSYKVMDETDLFFGFSRTGHLAGAVSITFEVNVSESKRLTICFGGDLGPQVLQEDESASLLRPVQHPRPSVDYLVLESTYGGKPLRSPLSYQKKIEVLSHALEGALSGARGVNPKLVIPSFTLGRTQELIVDLAYLITRTDFVGRIGGRSPVVVVDSTLARSYSNSYRREFSNWWHKQRSNERKMRLLNRKHALFAEHDVLDVDSLLDQLFAGEGRRMVAHRTAAGASFELVYGRTEISDGPVIYISSSGMCTSGPVMARLRDNLRRKDASVMFVGYLPSFLDASVLKNAAADWKSPLEVAAMIQDGPVFKEGMRLEDFGLSTNEVRASLLDFSGLYSGHADDAGLCDFALKVDNHVPVSKFKPIRVFLVHGEDRARGKLRFALRNYADSAQKGTSRMLEDVIIPNPGSGWYDLSKGQWEPVENSEPTWSESLKLLAEASDLQESISQAWFKYKSLDGSQVRQAEYLRRIDALLDNLEEWRSRFRRLTEKAIETGDPVGPVEQEGYDRAELYLDVDDGIELKSAASKLGLAGKVTRAQARIAWKELSREVHPDMHPNAGSDEKASLTSKMQELNEAHAILLRAFSALKG